MDIVLTVDRAGAVGAFDNPERANISYSASYRVVLAFVQKLQWVGYRSPRANDNEGVVLERER